MLKISRKKNGIISKQIPYFVSCPPMKTWAFPMKLRSIV
jgi:hypothetical protein